MAPGTGRGYLPGMRYAAHLLEPDFERVIHFDRDTDQEAIVWADAQWEGAHWTTTANGFDLQKPDGTIIHKRRRNRRA
jgi:hypothetical protein